MLNFRLSRHELLGWTPYVTAAIFVGVFLAFLLRHPHFSGDIFSPDIVAIVTAPYRMANGDVPNQDFMSPLGFLYYAPAALIRHVSHNKMPIEHAFVWGMFFMSLIAGGAALWFTRNDKAWIMRILLVAFSIATAGSVMAIDPISLLDFFSNHPLNLASLWLFTTTFCNRYFSIFYANGSFYSTYASLYGTYREFTAAFFGLVFFRWNYRSFNSGKKAQILDGIVLGGLLTILVYAKTSYFVFGALMLPVGYWLFPVNRVLHWTCLAIFTLLSLLLELAYGHVISGYVRDIFMIMQMHPRPFTALGLRHFIVSPLFVLLIAVMGLYFFLTRNMIPASYERRLAWLSLCWIPAYIGISTYDAGDGGRITSFAALILLCFSVLEKRLAAQNQPAEQPFQLNRRCALICCVLMAIPAVSSAKGQLTALLTKPSFDQALTEQSMYAMRDLVPFKVTNAPAFQVSKEDCTRNGIGFDECYRRFASDPQNSIAAPKMLNDGNVMLRRNNADNLLVLDFVDFFSIMLDKHQAKNLPTWFANETLTESCFPAGDTLFAWVDYVLEPKFPFSYNFQMELMHYYENDLSRLFVVVDQDDEFVLYKRRKPATYRSLRYECDLTTHL